MLDRQSQRDTAMTAPLRAESAREFETLRSEKHAEIRALRDEKDAAIRALRAEKYAEICGLRDQDTISSKASDQGDRHAYLLTKTRCTRGAHLCQQPQEEHHAPPS